MRTTVTVLMSIFVAALTVWAAGALYFSPILDKSFRPAIAAIFVVVTVLGFIFLPRRGWTLLGFVSVFCLLVVIYFRIPASNDRNWQPEVAVTPYATIKGDLVTIHGVRNFDYRTETDFDTRWETRTYDLQKLDTADLIAVYWAGKAIAHTMVSFGFEGQDYLTLSIETRKERDEGYSTIAGFFRQYELVYAIADERDVIRVRTNYRQPQFNVGVEIGQIVIVLFAWLVFLIRSFHETFWRISHDPIAVTSACVALFWAIQRMMMLASTI